MLKSIFTRRSFIRSGIWTVAANFVLLLVRVATGQAFRQTFLDDFYIAGTTHIKKIDAIEPVLKKGQRLDLFRENNPHDAKAIVIKDSNGTKLGYVPRDKNEVLSRLMDGEKALFAVIQSKEWKGTWLKIKVKVYLSD
ncbi:hypothetical protein FACS189419_08010 [Planctomycetales bacterium]|nr:hypothetical protein FACS189419_08010 [Planctomycetales bacterium]